LVGYSHTSKGYRLWNPTTNDIVERYDVTILEDSRYEPDSTNPDLKTIEQDVPLDSMDANEYEVDQILDHDEDPVDGFIFRVKWKHYPTKMATWEPASNLDCPDRLRSYFHRKHLPFMGTGYIGSKASVFCR